MPSLWAYCLELLRGKKIQTLLKTSWSHKCNPGSVLCFKSHKWKLCSYKNRAVHLVGSFHSANRKSGLSSPFLVPVPSPASEGVCVRSRGWYMQRCTGWCGCPLTTAALAFKIWMGWGPGWLRQESMQLFLISGFWVLPQAGCRIYLKICICEQVHISLIGCSRSLGHLKMKHSFSLPV